MIDFKTLFQTTDYYETEDGIYYLHDYVPMRRRKNYSDEDIEISEKVIDYKNGNQQAFNQFTTEIAKVISSISEEVTKKYIGLVAIPPSKADKESTVHQSIHSIKEAYEQGYMRSLFGCKKKIYDYSHLLQRDYDIRSSCRSYGNRPDYEEQKASISCIRNRLYLYHTAFILIDDVTTSGTIMDVCEDILIENGMDEDHIYRLAIAKTV